jgi:hypothetical protein
MASWNIGKPVQRMTVMVDIRDLKHIRRLIDTKPYLAAIRDCVHKILVLLSSNQYPAENEISTTVWAFKILDSSMSPYRSRSVIEKTVGKWAGHVPFESTTRTEAFVSALRHLANVKPNSQPRNSDFFHGGRLDFIVRSMQELINDYIWDPLIIEDGIIPHSIHNNHTNLVVLFSSFPWTRNGFNDFLMEEIPESGSSVKFPSSSDEEGIDGRSVKGRICKLQCIVDNLDLIEDSSTCNPIAGSLDFSEIISKNKADPKRLINWDNVKIHIAEVFKRKNALI